ncbi:MAG: outer membrane beta-barrel protein [bacterium]|nr:outer membrane beta-barrel protein [bacterium]
MKRLYKEKTTRGARALVLCLLLMVFTCVLPARESEDATDDDWSMQPKYTFELYFGMARVNPASIHSRDDGVDALVNQYSRVYDLTTTSTGEFTQSKLMIPLGFQVNYNINEKLAVTGGLEMSFGSSAAQKSYTLGWPGFNESQSYDHANKISLFMPRVGAAYKLGVVDIYGGLGLGLAKFSHTQLMDKDEAGDIYSGENTIDVSGSGIGLILGARYNVKLNKPLFKIGQRGAKFSVKLEMLLLKVSSLTGSRQYSASLNGARESVSVDGTAYTYEWNPYGTGWFEYWDLYRTAPTTGDGIRNAAKMSLNLSGIRLMIGISF